MPEKRRRLIMHRTRLEELADFVETSETYSQNTYFHEDLRDIEPGGYGTPGCLGGHASVLFRIPFVFFPHGKWRDQVQAFMGLNDRQAHEFFKSTPFCHRERPASREDAAATLRIAAKDRLRINWVRASA